jgi:hypothetical protein
MYLKYRKTEPKEQVFKYQFGLDAGFSAGLAYRYWPGETGFQETILPLKYKEILYVSDGVSYMRGILNFDIKFSFFIVNNCSNF